MDVRPKLTELLVRTQAEIQSFVDGLTPEERQQVGKADDWSAKDLVAHLAGWQVRMADRLGELARGEDKVQPDDVDAENALMWSEYCDRTWDEVLQALSSGHQRLMDNLQALSVDDLQDADRFKSQSGQAVWRSVAGHECTHPTMHLAEAYLRRGQPDRGSKMMESLAADLARLDASPRWVGVVRYNLACYLALAGETARAIGILAEALKLHPGLMEWSRQDKDLASLHGLPAYERLYAG
jgi:tetratricopeptide (TPR) repeat protein